MSNNSNSITSKLSNKQLNRITNRFVNRKRDRYNQLTHKDLSYPYLINDKVVATDAHKMVVASVDKLDYIYTPKEEDVDRKRKIERVMAHFSNQESSTILSLKNAPLNKLIKFLKTTEKLQSPDEETGSISLRVEINFHNENDTLNFYILYFDKYDSECEIEHTIESKDMVIPQGYNKEITLYANSSYLIQCLMSLVETGNNHTISFNEPLKPILLENSMIQMILLPMRIL